MANLSTEILKMGPAYADNYYREVTDGSRKPYSIPHFFNMDQHYNNWYSNGTSDPWQGVSSRGTDQGSTEYLLWLGIGGGGRGQGISYNLIRQPQSSIIYTKHDVAAYFAWDTQYQYTTAWNGDNTRMSRVFFLRNFHPSSTQSITWNSGGTSYWSQGGGGIGASYLTPNTNKYSTTTSMSHTNVWGSATSTSNTNNSYTVSIPPQTTIALINSNSNNYYTSWSSGVSHWMHNYTYNLQGWNNNWIQPDMRLTLAAATFNGSGWSGNTNQYQSHLLWQWAALQFGDR